MKKIITAIGNNILNENLIKLNKYEIIGRDIQYKEGILEFLKENKNVDVLIISELLDGDVDFKDLISKILKEVERIDIIVFLEEENRNLKNYLYDRGIYKIYKNNQIGLKDIEEILDEKRLDTTESLNLEIKKLKKIIEEQNLIENLKNVFGKIITLTGSYCSRKKYFKLYYM
ncbi:MAG: hypothetical protein IKM97_02100 [Clostridia bacterium]|nr:hypothetical protein [Clostridia bacterium]